MHRHSLRLGLPWVDDMAADSMTAPHILVVDDSRETVQHLARAILPSYGYRTSYAFDGIGAVRQIRADRPDLVILDLNLPEMTGLDVLELLAEDPLSVPVILMTGAGSEKSAIDAFRLGIKDYLIKPFTTREVIETIERVLANTEQDSAEKLAVTVNQLCRIRDQYISLIESGIALADLDTPDAVIEHVLAAARFQSQAESAHLWLPDPAGDQFIRYSKILDDAGAALPCPQPLAGLLRQVVTGGEHVRRAEFESGIDLGLPKRARAVLLVPLHRRDGSSAVLGLTNDHQPRAFSRNDEQLLTFLAHFVATTLDHVEARHRWRRAHDARARERDIMTSIANLVSGLEPSQAVPAAVAALQEQAAVEAVLLWLPDPGTESLHVYAAAGDLPERARQLLARYAAHVAASGQWLFRSGGHGYRRVAPADGPPDAEPADGVHSFVCVPLLLQGKVLGVLQWVNERDRRFDAQDIDRMMAVGGLLALAVSRLPDAT